jgi:hypothetical protein
MNKISNSAIINGVIKLFMLLAAAKFVSVILFVYLPSQSVELDEPQNYKPKYHRVDFKNMLNSTGSVSKDISKSVTDGTKITNMILKGLYGNSKNGFVIVALKSSADKTSIISIGEQFSGYTLVNILKDSAVFSKNNKNYVLRIENSSIIDVSSYITSLNKYDKDSDDSVKNVSKK